MSRVEDNRLATFTRICDEIAEERSYLKKAQILQDFLRKGTSKKKFEGDLVLWVRLLIPSESQRVYKLQNKQMLKIFSRLFSCDVQRMQLDLEQDGDVSETLRKFFEVSMKIKPQEESNMYLQEVEEFLQLLEKRTKEDEQMELLKRLCEQTTARDLKTVIRIIKKDLRMNAKASHILAAFGPMAYSSYQATRDITAVVKQFSFKTLTTNVPLIAATAKGKEKKAQVGHVQVMTPIAPMLANACTSVEEAFRKSPTGLFTEVKYDGERVQIHKKGNEFRFFSRNLKPVMDHKIKRFKEFIPKAFPGSGDMILDSEIILVDTQTDELLPFGSLGAHKRKAYSHAEVCLFVFDCILFKGEDLTNMSCRQRRKILEDNITPIRNYVQLSESHFLKTKTELAIMTAKVFKANLEGVVLKDPTATYQPGKRGWLKVKKDYLFEGRMADTADLVVLGASYGSGKKGGILSIFLMGCYDHRDRLWKTVTKVHTGLDDSTRLEMHTRLMILMERSNPSQQPSWLLCNKPLMPDFIAKDPNVMPVWEITGAEFTKSGEHTAAGISIRFPRITRLRDDKSAEQANDLEYLEKMYDASKNNVNVDLLLKGCNDENVEINSKINLGTVTPKKEIKREAEEEIPECGRKELNKFDIPSSSNKRKSTEDSKSEIVNVKQIKCEANNVEDNKPQTKPTKTETGLDFVIKKEPKDKPLLSEPLCVSHKESILFRDLTVYFEKVDKSTRLTKKFIANDGYVTKNPKTADLVFHMSCNGDLKLYQCRDKFRASCHHLSIQWLLDCLSAKKLLDYGPYAVIIR